jgi:YihY family inner membrane protein
VATFIDTLDRVQRRHRFLAFPHAVFKRYGEDNGGWAAAVISYYGFFSLFPLLVVFVSVATWVLHDRPDLLHSLLEAIWSRFPFVAATLQQSVERQVDRLEANVWVLVVSLLVTLWAGIGVVRVLQDAVNRVWGVARFRRPRLVLKIGRGLAILGLLGLGLAATGVVAGLTVTGRFPVVGVLLVAAVNIALAAVITLAVYRLSIAEPVSVRDLAPGALIVGAGAYALTLIAGIYVQNVVARMTGIYGPFATTIGLLAYVSLVVQLFVLATEVNVVRARELWPRSLTGRALGPADARAIDLSLRRARLLSLEQLSERGLSEAASAAVGIETVEAGS